MLFITKWLTKEFVGGGEQKKSERLKHFKGSAILLTAAKQDLATIIELSEKVKTTT